MTTDLLCGFRRIEMLRDLDEAQIRSLSPGSFLQAFPADTVLHVQDAVPDFLLGVVEGSLEVVAEHRGATNTVRVLSPGEVFAASAVMIGAPALAAARTAVLSRILMVPSALVRARLDADHDFARRVVSYMAEESRVYVRTLHNLKMRTSPQRLAHWLARRSATGEASLQFELPYQKKVLASLLGMTSENLSRTFAILEPHGVSIRGRHVEVRDRAALAALADPTPLLDAPA